jgi:hypothetical protein
MCARRVLNRDLSIPLTFVVFDLLRIDGMDRYRPGERGRIKLKNPNYWRRDEERRHLLARGSVGRELSLGTSRAVRQEIPAVAPERPALSDRRELVDLALAFRAADPLVAVDRQSVEDRIVRVPRARRRLSYLTSTYLEVLG